MKPYIFGARNGIYIVDLQKTVRLFKSAYDTVVDTVSRAATCSSWAPSARRADIIAEEADRCGMYYINNRWLGGMLTNFVTIKRSIERYKYLEGIKNDGTINRFPKKEAILLERQLDKLDSNLKGIKNLNRLPGLIFVVDIKKERIAVRRPSAWRIPSLALVDTNCDPTRWTSSSPATTTPSGPSGWSPARSPTRSWRAWPCAIPATPAARNTTGGGCHGDAQGHARAGGGPRRGSRQPRGGLQPPGDKDATEAQ